MKCEKKSSVSGDTRVIVFIQNSKQIKGIDALKKEAMTEKSWKLRVLN